MIVVLSSTPPELTDLERFDRLHAELHGEPADAQLAPLCRSGDDGDDGDDEHVWLDIAAARAAGVAASSSATFATDFDAMISFAAGAGWVDADGTHVRAHVERAG